MEAIYAVVEAVDLFLWSDSLADDLVVYENFLASNA